MKFWNFLSIFYLFSHKIDVVFYRSIDIIKYTYFCYYYQQQKILATHTICLMTESKEIINISIQLDIMN